MQNLATTVLVTERNEKLKQRGFSFAKLFLIVYRYILAGLLALLLGNTDKREIWASFLSVAVSLLATTLSDVGL